MYVSIEQNGEGEIIAVVGTYDESETNKIIAGIERFRYTGEWLFEEDCNGFSLSDSDGKT